MNARPLAVVIIGLTFLSSFAVSAQGTNSQWIAPEKPNPQTILNEATEDTSAGRYEAALAKQIWFRENALKIDPSFMGVRNSFALMYWTELGKSYPKALEKLKSIRDDNDKEIRGGRVTRSLFADFKMINQYLNEANRTKETFIWLDTNAPNSAKEVFDLAEPALVKAKEYRLCGKYLDPAASFGRMVDSYREQTEEHSSGKGGKYLGEFAQKKFSNDSVTLVALLVTNGQTAEADQIAVQAEKTFNDSEFKSLIEKAKKGEVPEPWP